MRELRELRLDWCVALTDSGFLETSAHPADDVGLLILIQYVVVIFINNKYQRMDKVGKSSATNSIQLNGVKAACIADLQGELHLYLND